VVFVAEGITAAAISLGCVSLTNDINGSPDGSRLWNCNQFYKTFFFTIDALVLSPIAFVKFEPCCGCNKEFARSL